MEQETTEPVFWEQFPYIVQESIKFEEAYYPDGKFSSGQYIKNKPSWNKKNLVLIMKRLVESEFGFVDICTECGIEAVDFLIEHNIIHYRPTSRCSFDLPSHNSSIITAESACGLYAMKMFE